MTTDSGNGLGQVLRMLLDGSQDPVPDIVGSYSDAPDGTGRYYAVRDNYKLQKVDGQRRLRRAHTFAAIDDFVAWMLRHADPVRAEICVAHPAVDQFDASFIVDAVLDPADPHSDQVNCRVPVDPLFARWCNVFRSGGLSQRDFYEFLVTSRESFPAKGDDGKPILSVGAQITNAVRQIRIESGSTVEADLDPAGFYRLNGSTSKTDLKAQIPTEFPISVSVVEGIGAYAFECFLRIGTTPQLSFTVRCPGVEAVLRKVRVDVASQVRSGLGEAFLVGVGALNVEPVPVIRPNMLTEGEVAAE